MNKLASIFLAAGCTVAALASRGIPASDRPGVVAARPEFKDQVYEKQAGVPIDPRVLQAMQPTYSAALKIVPPVEPPVDPTEVAVHQEVTRSLEGSLMIPSDRLAFYAALAHSPTETIWGWYAAIEEVEANEQGHLVTIVVIPEFTSTTAAAVILCCGKYLEQYQVTDGQVAYLGSMDLDHVAGRKFGWIGL